MSMRILPGWSVSYHSQTAGGAFMIWTVQKPGADGKIELSSAEAPIDGSACDDSSQFTSVTVNDIVPTQNNNLLFLAWSYQNLGDTTPARWIGIARADENFFQTTPQEEVGMVQNKDVKVGTYFACLSHPLPGSSLKLNQHPQWDADRDTISALSSSSSETHYQSLLPTAESYHDIKTMLASIK